MNVELSLENWVNLGGTERRNEHLVGGRKHDEKR